MKKLSWRHELKFFINYSDYLAITSRLKMVAMVDPFAKDDGRYKIRSLYFDNFYDKALLEKLDGINRREKFRIRYYNDDPTFIRLEKKSKQNGYCNKQSVPLTKCQGEKILHHDIAWMKNVDNKLMVELYSKMTNQLLRPMKIIDYIREAYIYHPGNTRITFDFNTCGAVSIYDFFDATAAMVQPNMDSNIILEVKYDQFLPQLISDMVQTNERRATAISKYALGRIYG